jgi:signal transduction histidine kinase
MRRSAVVLVAVTALAVALVVAAVDWSPEAARDPARALLLGPLQAFAADRGELLPPFDRAELVVFLLTGVAGVFSGLVVWRLRPADLTARLIVGAGLLWILSGVRRSGDPALFTLGALLTHTALPIVVQIALGYPTGRLRRRWERRAVGGIWFLATAGVAAEWLFFDPRTAPSPHPSTSRNLLLIQDLPGLAAGIQVCVGSATAVAAVAVVCALVARWRAGSVPFRAEFVAIAVAAVLLFTLFATGLLMTTGAVLSGPADQWVLDLRSPAMALLPLTVAFVVTRYYLAHVAIGSAMIEIGTAPLSDGFVEALRRALRDPGLVVWTYSPTARTYLDETRAPRDLPSSARRVTTLESNGSPVGAVIHDESLSTRPELHAAVRSATTLALEHAHLRNELRAQLEEVRRSRERIVTAGNVQRRRIERDLHDGAQQHLVAADIHLGRAKRATDDPAVREMIADAAEELRRALTELRDLARGVYPTALAEGGLSEALTALAERTPLPVEITDRTRTRLPAHVELAAYFVAAEAVANACKHAQADHVEIHIDQDGAALRMRVRDGGVGGAVTIPGGGLHGLTDRAAALGGTLDIDSPPGGGTTVRAVFPLGYPVERR